MPLEASPRAGSTCSSVGIAGPAPSEATYPASAAVCSSSNCAGLTRACGPLICIGIRPVDTWKSTAAAPTPTRDGTPLVPCAFAPWHVAQLAWNSFLPVSMSAVLTVSALAVLGARAA